MDKVSGSDQGRRPGEIYRDFSKLGAEYWSARDLQGMLGYSQWRRVEDVIKRAMTSCETSGNNADYHFAGVGKPITGGKGAVQLVYVHIGESEENLGAVRDKVGSRLFSYIQIGTGVVFCSVNIVLDQCDDNVWSALVKE